MSIFNIFKPLQRSVRRFFRQQMRPMTVDEAEEKREFFAKLYFLSAFGLFTCTIYGVYKQKIATYDASVPVGEYTIEKLKLDGNVRIMRFEGFKKVKDYYYVRKENEKGENQTIQTNQKENSDSEFLVETVSQNETEPLKFEKK